MLLLDSPVLTRVSWYSHTRDVDNPSLPCTSICTVRVVTRGGGGVVRGRSPSSAVSGHSQCDDVVEDSNLSL